MAVSANILTLAAIAIISIAGSQAHAQGADPARDLVAKAAAKLAGELSALCPAAEPGSQKAFDSCRAGLYKDSEVRAALPDFVLWGRQRDPKLSLKESKLTQFAPDVWAGMYLLLFMFNGQHTVEYVEREKLYLIRLQAAFRNRLTPGQFPYPFWHEAEKWAMYQRANEVLLWWDPRKARIKVAQFTVLGAAPPVVATTPVEPPPPPVRWAVDVVRRAGSDAADGDGVRRSAERPQSLHRATRLGLQASAWRCACATESATIATCPTIPIR